jgi:uncharacterized membrane protein
MKVQTLNRKKSRILRTMSIVGGCIALIGASLWIANFFSIYGDVSQTCSLTGTGKCNGLSTFNRQVHYRDIGQAIFVVGVVITGSCLALESKIEAQHQSVGSINTKP